MSKKIIGPALPPHLQHLLKSRHSEGDREDSLSDSNSKSPTSQFSPTPKPSVDDEDDGVLVLHVSDDELLADAMDGAKTLRQPSHAASSCRSDLRASDPCNDEMFGPTLPPSLKPGSRNKTPKSSDDEGLFGPVFPPNFKLDYKSRSKSSSDDEDSFTPALPPNLKTVSGSSSRVHQSSEEDDSFGATLPPNFKTASGSSSRVHQSSEEDNSFGPTLPPNFKTVSGSSSRVHQSSEEDDSFGPTLPPNFKTATGSSSRVHQSSEEDDSFGPALPPNFNADSSRGKVIGPTLPPGLMPAICENFQPNSESDDDVVGPMPPMQDSGTSASYIQQQLEARALKMKRKLVGEDEDSSSRAQARETWMLELPPDRSGEFGLGPRQFRARAKLDLGDRSVWTVTPTDREQRANVSDQAEATSTVDLKSETDMIAIAERDRAMQKLTDKHNKKKKRKESLVDLHQKKLKKKQKKEEEDGKPKERRPFDRNLDLQANRFDEAQKKAILRKAQLLDDRFSRGESKFL